MDKQIGKITHYYDKIGVAVVDLTGKSLKVGDTIKISGHDQEFTQIIGSLQVEHTPVEEVKPGDAAGMKVDKPVKPGDVLYKVKA